MADKTYLQAASVDVLLHILRGLVAYRNTGEADEVLSTILRRFSALEAERDGLREALKAFEPLFVQEAGRPPDRIVLRINDHTIRAKDCMDAIEALYLPAPKEAPGHDD